MIRKSPKEGYSQRGGQWPGFVLCTDTQGRTKDNAAAILSCRILLSRTSDALLLYPSSPLIRLIASHSLTVAASMHLRSGGGTNGYERGTKYGD